jgi:hypothetical protein
MAVPPLRRRASMLAIKNKYRKDSEELKARAGEKQQEQISEEEHKKRIKMLKSMGLFKEEGNTA